MKKYDEIKEALTAYKESFAEAKASVRVSFPDTPKEELNPLTSAILVTCSHKQGIKEGAIKGFAAGLATAALTLGIVRIVSSVKKKKEEKE